MKEIISNILNAFNNIEKKGFSAKKLTAFIITTCCVVAHIKWIALGDFKQLEMVLTIDYTFIATLFGINEYGKKITKKDEQKPTDS